MNAKLSKGTSDQSGQNSSSNKNDNENENDDSAGELNKDDSPNHNEEELGEEEEDELTKIKRSLRQDLKKRRGIVQKAGNDEVPVEKTKKPKTKSKKPRALDFAEDKK
jgi:hypothetical protein